MRQLILTAACTATLAACADSQPADAPSEGEDLSGTNLSSGYDSSSGLPKVPPPAPDPAAPEQESTLGSDRVMQGRWFARDMAGSPAALFGEPETEAQFSVRCEGEELIFSRSVTMRPGPASMALMARGKVHTIDATARTDPIPSVTGRLAASDAFAQTLGQATQPIAVRIESGPALRMPVSEALRTVIEGCAA